tara:strand:+ start:101 stop:1426 length:1326 start_codon:yes stop_codon:yes gene_type:complete
LLIKQLPTIDLFFLPCYKYYYFVTNSGYQAAISMKKKITTKLVLGSEVQDKVYDITDETLSGFILRVNPSGLKNFYVRYTLPNGKRGRMVLGAVNVITVAQARAEARKILGQVALGIDPKAPEHQSIKIIPTLKEFVEEQYKPWSEAHHQWSHSHITTLYRMKEFLNLPLNEIKVQPVEKWRSNCLKNKLAPSTVNRMTAVLRSVISRAFDWEVIETHPLARLKQLKVDRSPNIRYLTEDEESRLRLALDARELKLRKDRDKGNEWRSERGYELYPDMKDQYFADYLKPLILLSLNTGARKGEIFRLHWEDINFERKSLVLVMRGKRKSHTRHIPLNKEALDTLTEWRKQQSKSDKLVFPSKDGGAFNNVQTSWEKLRIEADITTFRWHDMRHHFASRLVMNGVPLNTVRELLGHTNLEMTLRYAHLAPEQKENAVATLDK